MRPRPACGERAALIVQQIRSGEGARPAPHPVLSAEPSNMPSPRLRGEGAATTTAGPAAIKSGVDRDECLPAFKPSSLIVHHKGRDRHTAGVTACVVGRTLGQRLLYRLQEVAEDLVELIRRVGRRARITC